MAVIQDAAFEGTLDIATLRDYLSRDRSVINRPGGKRNVTPLAAGCWNGKPHVVNALLNEGADPNALSPHNRTPLYFVTHRSPSANRCAIVQALISAKADVDKPCDDEGNTPLMNAIFQTRDEEVVQLLLDNGAKKTQKNARAETPEILAEKYRVSLQKPEPKVR